MTRDANRFTEAIALFDKANAKDPHLECVDGVDQPKELVYAQRMTAHLHAFAPDASEATQLAARAQHIRRWEIERTDYPEGRKGYLDWRSTLGRFHGDCAAAILAEAGYEDALIAKVKSLLRKENLRSDPEAQRLEDVICLVFLEHYLEDFAAKHSDDKMKRILRKTWRKMSTAGHDAALALELPEKMKALVQAALS